VQHKLLSQKRANLNEEMGMFTKPSIQTDDFWADDPEEWKPSYWNSNSTLNKIFRIPVILYTIFCWLFPVVIFAIIEPILALLWLAFMGSIIGLAINSFRRYKALHNLAIESQERARLITGAANIGSAIHVAGHPLLERDQPIVLALIDDQISIFGYASSKPIDTFYLKDLSALHTVVYDDERVPHIDVIDSAAQALQISLTKDGKPVTFLLRKMVKIRPIDWYHAIEKARYSI
jgi:hypothetical protein